jgi:serine/threonine protein kinase
MCKPVQLVQSSSLQVRKCGDQSYSLGGQGIKWLSRIRIEMPKCPQCAGELESDGPAGLCPQCLIQGALDTSLSAEESRTQTIDTASGTAGGDDFGRYQILRPLGEGGMGTVYLAEQREPIRRCVALKVIKLGMDTSQVLARFANERQALAIMDHPNIARIFDAGATRKGRPYFVMEYIEGAPITLFCDRKRMIISKRLELLLAVCRAVQHAHHKGVIHRDLKPSNVLVKEQEGDPLPKVIDFGIAKATDQWAVENTLLTQFGQMVGTPEYASPEQADVMTGAVDETSDVYSLGVLLYELLIGTVPFDVASMRRAGLGEMLRIIREEEAPPLSRKLNAIGAAAADIAAHRKTDPASLCRLVEGDLNCITLKALEKVRERRYSSVAELAADIQRYLEHRPALASPPGAMYRLRKFLRRHRPAVFGVSDRVAAWSLEQRDSPPRRGAATKITIVVGDFANTTDDPVFDRTLRQMMAVELGKSPYLSVLPDARMSETLRLMVRPSDAKLTPEIASEICERTGSAAVVEGWIARLGRQYVLGVRVRNCRTGDVLYEDQAAAAKQEEVFRALGQMANRFVTRASELLPGARKEPSLPTDATTPSLEAWRSYSAAMREFQAKAVTGRHRTAKARHRVRPQFCDGLCQSWPRHRGPRGNRTGGEECSQGLRAAGCCQRSGKLLHHVYVPPAVNQKPGTLSTDLGIMGAKIPDGSACPRVFIGLHIARHRSLRQSRRRRSTGDRTRSGFCHRLRKCRICLYPPEPPAGGRGVASQGVATEDRSRSVLAGPVLHRFSKE